MRLINSGLEILEQQPGLDGMYKQIELAGRTCYRSEDKITPDSAKVFVDRMIKSGHGAMLEHGTVYLKVKDVETIDKYLINKYTKVNIILESDSPYSANYEVAYITTNYRVLVENNWLDDLQYICEPTEYHEKRIAVRFTCDRGILAEFTRHRTFSFAAESTRQWRLK